MLPELERAALTARLRRGREAGTAGRITRRAAGQAILPASFGQEQLWFLDQFAPGLAVYNIPCVIRARGPLDLGALARAADRLAERHEALRTRLVPGADSRPVQVVDGWTATRLPVVDLTGSAPGERDARLEELIRVEASRPFDLAAGPLLRMSLVRLTPEEHELVAVVHHAVFDGWSAGVFLRDLAALYAAEGTGGPSGLGQLPVQFADYAIWERQRLTGSVLADLESYWRQRMAGFETVQFPTDRPRPAVDDFSGASARRITDAALLTGLREVSRREGVTMFVTVLAGLLTLIYRYTGQGDLVVGTISANRSRTELTSLIGFLVNTLPIRCELLGDLTFGALLGRVNEATIGAFTHQDLPFATLVDILKVEREASRAPVVQIVATYAERDDAPVHAAGVEFANRDLVRDAGAAKFDLTLAAQACDTGLVLECRYKTSLFDAGTIERLLGHLEVLLRGVVADPSARLSRLPLLTGQELRAELTDWNDTAGPVPPGCVHEGFEAQAARTPNAIAAQYEGERITYQQLNRQANRVARLLRDLGTGPDSLVGVSMGAGLRRLVVLLGILKAGGGYVPLDPALPAERMSYMIADTVMSVIVTDDASAGSVPAAAVVNVDAEWDRITGLDGGDLAGTGVTPGCLAYVLYTSGSTGQPKGVMVEHRNMVNTVHGMNGHWGIGPGSVILQFASLTFDVSALDMFMALLCGAKLVLAAPGTLHSPARLAALMRQTGVTFANLPPAVLGLLPDGEYPDLRVMISGGEELPAEVARRWIRPGLRMVNAYGPTETTVLATFAELDAATPMPPPIGFPVRPNYRVYVLDQHLNPVPVGVAGELHIGGASVSRGYLNRPELTGDRFIPDPFVSGRRLYKTGDLVRRQPDGSIAFAGRIDGQVKIRGIRIELGEIEAVLVTHPDVAQAVVAVVTGPTGDTELAAYLRLAPGGIASEQEMRRHLARLLPAPMIPAHFVTVETFPLNASGKVDRKALPTPRRRVAREQAGPTTPTEAALAGLYAALLRADRVGVADSFFDLGGNSLTAMRLVDMIARETGADISVTSIFLHPTPRQLAAAIDAGRERVRTRTVRAPWVELNGGSAGSPLFLMHPVGGTVSAYAPLGQELADMFRVYGLESPGLGDGAPVASSLADLVTDYTRRIRAVQTAGPYALAGWSMGGVIAFEIARRLERAGADVGLLVLLDTPFAVPADYPADDAELAARFVADAAHSLALDTTGAPDAEAGTAAGQFSWLAGRMAGIQSGQSPDHYDRAARDVIEAGLGQRFGLFATHIRMLAGYRPTGNGVRAATLIVSAAGSPNAPARTQWLRHLDGEVSVLSVDSDHYAFLRPPLVQDVGAAIGRLRGRRPAPDPTEDA